MPTMPTMPTMHGKHDRDASCSCALRHASAVLRRASSAAAATPQPATQTLSRVLHLRIRVVKLSHATMLALRASVVHAPKGAAPVCSRAQLARPQARVFAMPTSRKALRRSAVVVASTASAASEGNATTDMEDAFSRLQGTQVYQVSTQHPVDITSLWGPSERAVLVFARHTGCETLLFAACAVAAAAAVFVLQALSTLHDDGPPVRRTPTVFNLSVPRTPLLSQQPADDCSAGSWPGRSCGTSSQLSTQPTLRFTL